MASLANQKPRLGFGGFGHEVGLELFQARGAEERETGRFFDLDVEQLTGESRWVAVEDDDFVMGRAAR